MTETFAERVERAGLKILNHAQAIIALKDAEAFIKEKGGAGELLQNIKRVVDEYNELQRIRT